MFKPLLTLTVGLCFSNFGSAQLQPNSADLVLNLDGKVVFWPFDTASIEAGSTATTSEPDGSFSLLIPLLANLRNFEPVRNYDGSDCLSSSNPASEYLTIFYLDVYQDDDFVAQLYLQSPRFDWRVGEGIKEFHYYTEATTVKGRCVIEFDDGFQTTYVFPDLPMQAGWNELTGVVTTTSETSETITLTLDDEGAAFRWELEAPSLEIYGGIGATTTHADKGILVTGVDANGPAAKAGLEAGDIIIKIDDEETADMNIGAAILRMRGPTGEMVTLRIIKGNEEKTIEIVREQIQ